MSYPPGVPEGLAQCLEHRRDATCTYPLWAHVLLAALDLAGPVLEDGQKGAACHPSKLKEELWLPRPDRKSMRSHVICGAWL